MTFVASLMIALPTIRLKGVWFAISIEALGEARSRLRGRAPCRAASASMNTDPGDTSRFGVWRNIASSSRLTTVTGLPVVEFVSVVNRP